LSRSRPGIKYLRLTEPSKNRSVIIEMTAQRLDEISDRNGYGWNGTSKRGLKANHLGIYNASWQDIKRGNISIYAPAAFKDMRGWGFGHRELIDDGQGYCWDGEPIDRTVFEIAVKSRLLTAAEAR